MMSPNQASLECSNCRTQADLYCFNLSSDLERLGISLPVSDVFLCPECSFLYQLALSRELERKSKR